MTCCINVRTSVWIPGIHVKPHTIVHICNSSVKRRVWVEPAIGSSKTSYLGVCSGEQDNLFHKKWGVRLSSDFHTCTVSCASLYSHMVTKTKQNKTTTAITKTQRQGQEFPSEKAWAHSPSRKGGHTLCPLHTKHIAVFRGCLRKFAHASLFFSLSLVNLTILEENNKPMNTVAHISIHFWQQNDLNALSSSGRCGRAQGWTRVR